MMIQRGEIISIHKTEFLVRVVFAGVEQFYTVGAEIERRQDGRLSCAVGDLVEFDTNSSTPHPILKIVPRRSSFWRPGPSHRRQKSLAIAANIDLVIGVLAFEQPPLNLSFAVRLFLRAATFKLPILLLANKTDLIKEEDSEYNYLVSIGYPLLPISLANQDGLSELWTKISGKTAVLVGLSGAGKSSLIGHFKPAEMPEVGVVRDGIGKGKHTTTSSLMYFLKDGTRLIDTPGVKELGIHDLREPDWESVFPDIAKFAAQCRFRDCSHGAEPGCSVNHAVTSGELPVFRLQSYVKLLEEWKTEERDRLYHAAH